MNLKNSLFKPEGVKTRGPYVYTILINYGTMELRFTMENYGIMEKTMVLWIKLWYYGQNFGTKPRTMELRFTKEKTW